jgi:predicted amidohydrolase
LALQTVKIGMAQLLVEGGEPERNLQRAEEMICQAAQGGCQIVLFPEALDLAWTHPSAQTEALPVPGKYSERLCRTASECGVYVCAGLTENAGDRVYNCAILINTDGEIILKYRKINVLSIGFEYYAIGNMLSVVETPFGVIGVNICADNYIDSIEIGHTLARMGAQLILSPSSWTVDYSQIDCEDPYGEKWFKPYHTLASLYGLVIVSATSVGYIVGGPYEGKKSVGCSLAVGPDGIIARGTYNEFAGELVIADIPILARKKRGTDIGEMLTAKGYYS